jgi:hypothetical protein
VPEVTWPANHDDEPECLKHDPSAGLVAVRDAVAVAVAKKLLRSKAFVSEYGRESGNWPIVPFTDSISYLVLTTGNKVNGFGVLQVA